MSRYLNDHIRHNQLLLPLLFPFVICACKSQTEQRATYSQSLIPNTYVTIQVDNTSPNYSNYTQVYSEGDREYLVFGNHEKKSIQFYDLQTTKLAREIKLHKDGPNGIGGLYGFLVKSKDSIYVLNGYSYHVYLVDGRGEVLKIYALLNDEKRNRINNPADLDISTSLAVADFGSPLIIRRDTLYLVGIPDGNPLSKKYYLHGKVNIWMDLKSSKHGLNYSYPEIYSRKNLSYLAPIISRCLVMNRFVYSFGGSNNLFVTRDFITSVPHPAGSRFFKAPDEISRSFKNTDQSISLSAFKTASFFLEILFDPYRQVYYRIALLGNPHQKNVNLEKDAISIIILNKDFQKIGETLLKKDTYLYKDIFVAKRGLYISTVNPLNPKIRENSMTYRIFKLKMTP